MFLSVPGKRQRRGQADHRGELVQALVPADEFERASAEGPQNGPVVRGESAGENDRGGMAWLDHDFIVGPQTEMFLLAGSAEDKRLHRASPQVGERRPEDIPNLLWRQRGRRLFPVCDYDS